MLHTSSQYGSVIRSIETPCCYVSIDDKGIALTKYKKDTVVTLDEMKIIEHVLSELTNNKPFKNLLDARGGYTSFDADARKYAAAAPITKQIIASAFVVNTLPLKLLVNFYLQFNKPQYKIKVFSDYDIAYWWLIKYSDK